MEEFLTFLNRSEKSSALSNKGQSRGLGALQQTGNYGLEIYFAAVSYYYYLQSNGASYFIYFVHLHSQYQHSCLFS